MIHYSKVVNGLAQYIDHELAAQFTGSLKGWAIGAVGGILTARAGQIITKLMSNPIVVAMGIADGEMIDEELLFNQLVTAANKGSATAELPLLGPVTFTAKDVESLHRYIIGGCYDEVRRDQMPHQ